MPYSFTKIEEDKTKTIGFVFSFLIIVYFAVFWLIAVLFFNFLNYEASPRSYFLDFNILRLSQILIILGVALIIGYAHWSYTTAGLIEKILGVLKAERLNPQDRYHQMFKNIVDEVSVATGGRAMEPVVIPTMAMNAFAVADFSGQAVIGLTEGMLARLTRAQIEAVVGHEAAHIVAGDCLATTVTTSLFDLFNGILRGFEAIFRGGSGGRGRGGYSSVRVSGRGGGGVIVFLILIYILLSVTKVLSQLARLFISRQREYRADAIAVRLTRDPLSLAEALYAISYRWRGGGLPAQELQSIFIVNPVYSAVDETDNLWSEMFSTHPPIEGRLNVLLDMAHSNVDLIIKDIERQEQRPRVAVPEVGISPAKWMAHKDGAWQGPFTLKELTALGWIRPDTWVQRVGGKKVEMAYQEQDILSIVSKGGQEPKTGSEPKPGSYNCPKCCLPLTLIDYEGTEVHKCALCRGALVDEADIQRIIIRREVGFTEKIRKTAAGLQREEKRPGFKAINRDPKTLLMCPKCLHPRTRMMRMFYTEVYRVEVDKCFTCGLIWFDGDELEVLQCLIEDGLNKSRS